MSNVVLPTLTSAAENPPPDTLTRTGSTALGKDEFLKILVAQLANQDPTQPQDSTAFVAELAQFSSLEAQQNTVSNLNALMIGQATANQTAVICGPSLGGLFYAFGPTTVYALMQAMGVDNDHLTGCDIRARAQAARESFTPP